MSEIADFFFFSFSMLHSSICGCQMCSYLNGNGDLCVFILPKCATNTFGICFSILMLFQIFFKYILASTNNRVQERMMKLYSRRLNCMGLQD